MITTLANDSTNSPIDSLQKVLDGTHPTLDWLVITHNEPRIARSLSTALAEDSAALLQLSQDTWNFEEGNLPEAIAWAVQEKSIKHLALVGCSLAGASHGSACLLGSGRSRIGVQNESGRDANHLVAGVKLASARNHYSQQRFADQLEQLAALPFIQHRCASGDLALHGLFYRAESGLYLSYNFEQSNFQPLVN